MVKRRGIDIEGKGGGGGFVTFYKCSMLLHIQGGKRR